MRQRPTYHKDAPSPKPRGPCAHLGAEVRQLVCETCTGKTRIKVFACAIHGECTVGKQLEGLACCAGCKDYTA